MQQVESPFYTPLVVDAEQQREREHEAPEQSRKALATRMEKVYMGIAAFEAIVILAIAFTVFGLVEANIPVPSGKEKSVPVYLAVFIMAQVFSIIYIFDALRLRNVVQLLLHLWFNICILAYSIVQIPQTYDALNALGDQQCGSYARCEGPDSLYNVLQPLLIVAPIILGLCTIAFAVLIRKLYVQFGWAEFHLVGASPEMKTMHREYQILMSLLKLLLFFGMAFCIAYLILVASWRSNTRELVLACVALPLVIIAVFLCGWAVRRENKWVMGGILVLMVIGLGYFIYKLASMFLPATSWLYINTRVTMAIFSAFAIIILIITFIFGCICMSNFGKGLAQAHQNPSKRTSLWQPKTKLPFQEKVRDDVDSEERQRGRVEERQREQEQNRLVID